MTYSYSTILLLSIGLFYVTKNEAIPLFSRVTLTNNIEKSVQCCIAISISSLEAGHVCRNCILTPRTKLSFFAESADAQKNSTKTILPYQNFEQNETNCISQQEEDFLNWRRTPTLH